MSGVGDALRRRCGGGVDIAAWAYQDDGRYSCRMSGTPIDGAGEENRGRALAVPSHPSVERAAN